MTPLTETGTTLKAVELFAGVGGFHLGLERAGSYEIVWSNQWEPGARVQFASECYRRQFKTTPHLCRDISQALRHNIDHDPVEQDLLIKEPWIIPDHDVLVGGFPCQDYSVAKPLNQAHGIEGKKGVLWWEIYKLLEWKRPKFAILENVDRLLKSPGKQRGRDFEIILACFRDLGYAVEWRVINAGQYGFPQKRRRVFIVAMRADISSAVEPISRIFREGILARAFPVEQPGLLPGAEGVRIQPFEIEGDAHDVTVSFEKESASREYLNAGFMRAGRVWTVHVKAKEGSIQRAGPSTLGEVIAATTGSIPEEFFLSEGSLDTWKYLKGAKDEPRTHKGSGAEYSYNEGALPFPDPLDRPARTILTGEGGSSPSRFKHVVEVNGRFRRLIPDELEELNGFPRGWTEYLHNDSKMTDVKRAFCMGNALVVGVVERIGLEVAEEHRRIQTAANAVLAASR